MLEDSFSPNAQTVQIRKLGWLLYQDIRLQHNSSAAALEWSIKREGVKERETAKGKTADRDRDREETVRKSKPYDKARDVKENLWWTRRWWGWGLQPDYGREQESRWSPVMGYWTTLEQKNIKEFLATAFQSHNHQWWQKLVYYFLSYSSLQIWSLSVTVKRFYLLYFYR